MRKEKNEAEAKRNCDFNNAEEGNQTEIFKKAVTKTGVATRKA